MKLLFKYWEAERKFMSKPFELSAAALIDLPFEVTMLSHLGISDREGAPLFEGDIIQCKVMNKHEQETEVLGTVKYNSAGCFFFLDIPATYLGMRTATPLMHIGAAISNFRIVANMFQQPDLLPGAQNDG